MLADKVWEELGVDLGSLPVTFKSVELISWGIRSRMA